MSWRVGQFVDMGDCDQDTMRVKFNLDFDPEHSHIADNVAGWDELDGQMRSVLAVFDGWAQATRLSSFVRLQMQFKLTRAYMLAARDLAKRELGAVLE